MEPSKIPSSRPPRLQPELPFGEVTIPQPPEREHNGVSQMLQVAVPLVTIIGYVLVSSMGGVGRNPVLLLPMMLSVLASAALGFYVYREERRIRIELEEAYRARLAELYREMHTAHDVQRRYFSHNYPDSLAVLEIARDANEQARTPQPALRSGTRLWERRRDDHDFGVVRLGIGSRPSTVVYTVGEIEHYDTPLIREAQRLADESRVVRDIPVTINLRKPPDADETVPPTGEPKEVTIPMPSAHALAIVGEQPDVVPLARALLAQVAVFHAPGDARIYVLGSDPAEWAWVGRLPHASGGEQAQVFFSRAAAPDASADDAEEGAPRERFLEGLRKQLSTRRILLDDRDENSDGRGDPTLPHLVVLVDLLATLNPGEEGLESDAAIALLLDEGARLGATVIFLVRQRAHVPGGCRALIEAERTPGTAQITFRYAETGVNSARYLGVADAFPELGAPQSIARAVEALDVRQSASAKLAPVVPFLELIGCASMADVRRMAERDWHDSTRRESANWLRARIGRMPGDKPRQLVFSSRRDGVHGLIAGSTGSGKSELLVALLMSLALRYDPTTLNFVLIDFKGGTAFEPFRSLPHCVDVITNLRGAGVQRMFTAVQAEIQRRQRLNAESGTNTIVDYRAKGYHLEPGRAPYPFLFIVIDEFAEMLAEYPDSRHQLESITRVGRSLGVSLILAAQRPSGVTDQMRSNIKWRIALRVESPGESRELLRRGDAAFLPMGVPGRGYLQVGNEAIELFQSAYAGGAYVDPTQRLIPVIWPKRGGVDIAQEQRPVYRAIIDELARLAATAQRPRQQAPWPGFLPERLTLGTPLLADDPRLKPITAAVYLSEEDQRAITLGQPREDTAALSPALDRWLSGGVGWISGIDWLRHAGRPAIGLVDNPYEGVQHPLILDMRRGHYAIIGTAGSGKSALMRTWIAALAASHHINHAHVYALDLGSRDMTALAALPHVGAVIAPDTEGFEERVEQLLRTLDEMIDERKQVIGTAGDVYEYNAAHPDAPVPLVFVAIDNIASFVEAFGGDREDTLLDRLVGVARRSREYGIHFALTASRASDLPVAVFNLFTERIALRQAEAADFRTILGASVVELGDIPGRGYVRLGLRPLQFQIALTAPHLSDEELARRQAETETQREQAELRRLAEALQAQLANERRVVMPQPVGMLPRAALFRDLLRATPGFPQGAFWQALEQWVRTAWRRSADPTEADYLEVLIGIISGGRPRTLRLQAQADGVHGMVAGGTGSGKSELLTTMIVALALRYDPYAVNFVLVDFKGGGAFEPFRTLPHCVDVVTNLNPAAVRRMFVAINAEMDRRQALNTDAGVKDIVEYRKKGLHLQRAPLPFLYIIIDEYSEMIATSPEFRESLDRIARVGRSLGVHLLLASQKPAGVSDQMRANIKLRLCLRVEDVETSKELLRRPDAALLPGGMPGRGYLQVGNTNPELIQVSYTGEAVRARAGEPALPAFCAPHESGEPRRFFEVVVALANQLLGTTPRPQAPWPPFLPDAVGLNRTLDPKYFVVDRGEPGRPMLNPAVADWMAGRGQWPRLDWLQRAGRAAVGLMDDPFTGVQRPLTIDLNRGHAVVFGASGSGKTTFIRTLVLSMAVGHSPDAFHAHLLDLGGRNLAALRDVPHVGTVIIPDEGGYEERVQQLWRELVAIIDERKRLFGDARASTLNEYNSKAATPEPLILVAFDNFAEFIDTFGPNSRNDREGNPFDTFVMLARQGRAFGLTFLITVERLNVLSSKLYALFSERFALRLTEVDDYGAIVGAQLPVPDDAPGRGYTRFGGRPLMFQVALIARPPGNVSRSEADYLELLGERMRASIAQTGPLQRPPRRINALATSVNYRAMLAETLAIDGNAPHFIDAFEASMRQMWRRNAAAAGADWLHVDVGVIGGDARRVLYIKAQADGVHGMVAGGTGSGKSELLTTLIVGMAVRYDPSTLNFVLVDYKGGGAFEPFRRLPHTVDLVTNLNKAAVRRMFVAINAEMDRRQALNTSFGAKDIVEYRGKGFHLTHQPLPFLFIFIDEYAEMISDSPEFRDSLERIARVGRSLGVHLLLASQKPAGVSDQMRANIKLRLCLRVEDVETSKELLRRPDAALLPSGMPGRGYLQVGNTNPELIQVAYAGLRQPDDRQTPVLWPGRPAEVAGDGEVPRLFEAVVEVSARLWGTTPVSRPWPAFLPARLTLETPTAHGLLVPEVSDWINGERSAWPAHSATELTVTYGIADDPYQARQFPVALNLARGHLAILGDTSAGKSSLLRTIVIGLAARYSPRQLQVYILDMGGHSFEGLRGLPHVGAVICADETKFRERLTRLVRMLERLIEERQRVLADAGIDSLVAYNALPGVTGIAATLVVIDNMAELRADYELLMDGDLAAVVRRSLAVGIVFVATGNTTNNFGRMFGLFNDRLTLRQSDVERYQDVVGRVAGDLDPVPGRGYILTDDRRALHFQAATALGLPDAPGRTQRSDSEDIARLVAAMARAAHAAGMSRTPPVPTLEERIALRPLLRQTPVRSGAMMAVIGKDDQLGPALVDLALLGPHFIISGPPLSGKTTALTALVLSLATSCAPDELRIVLIDPQARLFEPEGRGLGALPHVLARITEASELPGLVEQIREEFEGRDDVPPLLIAIDNYDEFGEDIERSQRDAAATFANQVRRYGRAGLHVVVAGTFDSSATSELRRRVASPGYGLALQSDPTSGPVRANRSPLGARDALPVARGFRVKAGQTTMVQVASLDEQAGEGDPAEAAARAVEAVAAYVDGIRARYEGMQGAWISVVAAPDDVAAATPAQPAAKPALTRALPVLVLALQRDTQRQQQGVADAGALVQRVAAMDEAAWSTPAAVAEVLTLALVRERVARDKEPVALAEAMVLMYESDVDRLIAALQEYLA